MSGRTTDIMGVRNQPKKLISFCHQKTWNYHHLLMTGGQSTNISWGMEKTSESDPFCYIGDSVVPAQNAEVPLSFNILLQYHPLPISNRKTIQIFSRGTCLCIILVQELSLIVVLLQKYCSPWFLRLNHDSSPNWHIYIYVFYTLFVCLFGWLVVRSFLRYFSMWLFIMISFWDSSQYINTETMIYCRVWHHAEAVILHPDVP
jgi:hypothetical protein